MTKKMSQTTIDAGEKDKNKYTFDGKGKEDAVETLNKFLRDCNNKDYGRKITVSDVIARGLRKLDLKDISLLQEQSMSLMDSIRHKFMELTPGNHTDHDFAQWIAENLNSKARPKNIN